MVYAVRRLSDGMIKIGCASHLMSRVSNLNYQYGGVVLLHAIPGEREDERMFHARFEAHRIYRPSNRVSDKYPPIATDWFHPVPEILNWIAEGMPA